jgi:hypothetical protein
MAGRYQWQHLPCQKTSHAPEWQQWQPKQQQQLKLPALTHNTAIHT